jgi:hypothetical protein
MDSTPTRAGGARRLGGREASKILHLLLCDDPGCGEGIYRAAALYGRVRELVRVISPREAAREVFRSGAPLHQLVEARCPYCGETVLTTINQMVEWERGEDGEPVAVCCSDACAAGVVLKLARVGARP